MSAVGVVRFAPNCGLVLVEFSPVGQSTEAVHARSPLSLSLPPSTATFTPRDRESR